MYGAYVARRLDASPTVYLRKFSEFASYVRRRDRSCVICGSASRTEIHHIIPFSDRPDMVPESRNVVLLCVDHPRAIKRKEYAWAERLRALVKEVICTYGEPMV
jgi:hypothetical protein